MGAVAIPIITAIAGGGLSIAKTAADAKKIKQANAKAAENQYLFSPEERAHARALLTGSLFGTGAGPFNMQTPVPGQSGVPVGATPQQLQMAQFMKMVYDRYSRPSAPYQGYLQALQERRDARGGVPGVPPQGPGDPSAQRQNPNTYGGGRTF